MTNRGNGYWEADHGVFNSCLIKSDYYTGDVIIAKTDGELVIGYADSCSNQDRQEVEKWADEYGYPVEWE